MCDLIGKLQSADKLRSSAGLSTCYRPYAEFLEQHMKHPDLLPASTPGPNPAFRKHQ